MAWLQPKLYLAFYSQDHSLDGFNTKIVNSITFKTRVKQQLLCFIQNMSFSSLVLFLFHISKVKDLCKFSVIKSVQNSIPPLTSDNQFLPVTKGHYLSSGNKRKADRYSTYSICIGDTRLPRILKESQLGHFMGEGNHFPLDGCKPATDLLPTSM